MSSDERTRIQPDTTHAAAGTQLSGIYELDERLASGGMGEVYRGHNIQTGDLVAIKIVLPEFARDQTILSLFRKEASILNRLSHDAIVRYHVFTIDPGIGRPYLAMEYVDGESLFDVMRRGPMPTDDVRRLCIRLAAGLGAVHEANTLHRDLSPDNIILPGGRVDRAKIIDFGIARSAGIGDGTLIGGRFAGKYNYVSPEQLGLFGGEVSEKSDIYSLGLVLAAALRGKPIEMSGSQVEIVEKRRVVPDLTSIDDDFRPVIEAMLQPDPADRPSGMYEIVEMARAGLSAGSSHTERPRTASVAETSPHRDASLHPWLEEPSSTATPTPKASVAKASPPPTDQSWKPDSAQPGFVSHRRPALLDQARPAPARPEQATRGQSWKNRTTIVAVSVIVVALGMSAGAYFGGVFGPLPQSREPARVPAPLPEPPLTKPPLTKPEVTGPPAGAGVGTAGQTGERQGAPESIPLEPSAPGPAAPSVEPPAVKDAEGPQPDEESGRLPDPRQPSDPATVALDGVADRISWLREYSGGDCFYATATSANDTAIEIEGFGTAVEPFQEMMKAFQSKFDIEPEVGVRLIEPSQCAVTDFLRGLGAGEVPQLTLYRTSVESDSPVSGALKLSPGRKSNLLLIDHKGMAFNLDDRVAIEADTASFNIPIGLSAADRAGGKAVPQIIMAVSASRDIEAASFRKPTPASEVLPRILAEMQAKGIDGAAAAKYFRLGG
jgi:serine/threonine-protein kinase